MNYKRNVLACLTIAMFMLTVSDVLAFDTKCPEDTGALLALLLKKTVQLKVTGNATGIEEWSTTGAPKAATYTIDGGRGFIVGDVIVTATHVLYPDEVSILSDDGSERLGPLVRMVGKPTITVTTQDGMSFGAEIAHLSHRYDLAILTPLDPMARELRNDDIVVAETWRIKNSSTARGSLLRKDSCIAMLAPKRDRQNPRITKLASRVVKARIISFHPLSRDWRVIAALSKATMTVEERLLDYGDSGSPIIGFQNGQPVLVGVAVSINTDPSEAYGYISRIDPIIDILAALNFKASSAQAAFVSVK